MINNIFEYKLDIPGGTNFEKFTIKTPKEFKYVTRIGLINFTDCSNGCIATSLTVIDNSIEIVKNVFTDFFVFQPVTLNSKIKEILFPVNIKGKENVFEVHIKGVNGGNIEQGQYRLIIWAEQKQEQDFFYEQEEVSLNGTDTFNSKDFNISEKKAIRFIGLKELNDRYREDVSVIVGSEIILNKVFSEILKINKDNSFVDKFPPVEIEHNNFSVQIFHSTGTLSGWQTYYFLMVLKNKKDDILKQKQLRQENKH